MNVNTFRFYYRSENLLAQNFLGTGYRLHCIFLYSLHHVDLAGRHGLDIRPTGERITHVVGGLKG